MDDVFIIIFAFCIWFTMYDFYIMTGLSWFMIVYSLTWLGAVCLLLWLNFLKNPVKHQRRSYSYMNNHAHKIQNLSKQLGLAIREPDLINPLLDTSCIKFVADNSNPELTKPQYKHLCFHDTDLKHILSMKQRSDDLE